MLLTQYVCTSFMMDDSIKWLSIKSPVGRYVKGDCMLNCSMLSFLPCFSCCELRYMLKKRMPNVDYTNI